MVAVSAVIAWSPLASLFAVFRCRCGCRDVAAHDFWRTLPPCSGGCGRRMNFLGYALLGEGPREPLPDVGEVPMFSIRFGER